MRLAVQDLDQWLGLKLMCNYVASLRYDHQPISLGDLGGMMAWPRQMLYKRGQHEMRHH